MKGNRYDCILFDFDGTLVPSLDFWLSGFKYAFAELGHNVTEEDIIAGCFYSDFDVVSKKFGIDCNKTFWQLAQHKLLSHYEDAELFEGARAVLEFCLDSRVPLGLVTSSERVVIDRAFHHLELDKFFNVVITADDTVNLKPNPEPVLKALQKLEQEPARTLFIGDYIVDVKAGKAAGTSTGIFYSDSHKKFHEEEHLRASNPDFMFHDYKDLLALLQDEFAL